MTIGASFIIYACSLMLLAVSWKDIGSVVPVKQPKKESITAAKELLQAPVLPISHRMNFGSQPAIFRKCFSGERNTWESML